MLMNSSEINKFGTTTRKVTRMSLTRIIRAIIRVSDPKSQPDYFHEMTRISIEWNIRVTHSKLARIDPKIFARIIRAIIRVSDPKSQPDFIDNLTWISPELAPIFRLRCFVVWRPSQCLSLIMLICFKIHCLLLQERISCITLRSEWTIDGLLDRVMTLLCSQARKRRRKTTENERPRLKLSSVFLLYGRTF